MQTHVPPKAPGEKGIYGTIVVLKRALPEIGNQVPLEGISEEESSWLAAVLDEWGSIPRRSESSVE